MRNNSADTKKNENVNESSGTLKYVLITPAWNESAFIELTLASMIIQTTPPIKWVIVSDGSTDGTDDIVKKYAAQSEWIDLVQLPMRSDRHFAAKVHAFNKGYAKVKGLEFDIIGNVDADISFGEEHFDFLVTKFAENPKLGVAGTAYIEESFSGYDYNKVNIEDVTGQCQIFRRECFEEIGGYVPIKVGGIDSVAVLTARMKGWNTKTFIEKTFVHHRKVGAAQGTLRSSYKAGEKDYYGGGHPLWEVFRSLNFMRKKPYVVCGLLMFSGFISGYLRKVQRPISVELMAFRRKEQMQRLKKYLISILRHDQ